MTGPAKPGERQSEHLLRRGWSDILAWPADDLVLLMMLNAAVSVGEAGRF